MACGSKSERGQGHKASVVIPDYQTFLSGAYVSRYTRGALRTDITGILTLQNVTPAFMSRLSPGTGKGNVGKRSRVGHD